MLKRGIYRGCDLYPFGVHGQPFWQLAGFDLLCYAVFEGKA